MVQLALLITKRHRLLSVAAILDVFESVNRFYQAQGESSFFDIKLFTLAPESTGQTFGSYELYPVETSEKQDLILIPAFASDITEIAVGENIQFIPWLQQQYQNGAEIASFCTGAFLLAATGLLNGKSATTHVNARSAFAASFPAVRLYGDAIVTDEDRIYTSGGATSSFHLMLHLLKIYCGREVVLHIAKLFAIDMDREQQAYFGTFQPPQNHGDNLVTMAQKKIEDAYQESSTIEEMIQDIPASRRNVVRRFKLATGVTPIEYLQKTRIEAAKKLLEFTDQSVLEVMLNSGYNDLKAFRQLFKKSAGMTPKSYREKFNVGRMEGIAFAAK
ncbi:GlxA family transcriptional regulator [Dyadobacter frigoris]|uniref:Helix-turn-helix domain-containing protein n=1 Tax=Dyadobacter frigoris TaxID=2576211 RepID=A0A4U6D9Y1_9BACT|nr:helix-turn-helix domain-containing protein [Dyadobacter frigoris]TKT94340.1 helix-turn-helix domain-containing protein [Dyadobacter frigoris]GLU56683.1 AraC family transcriptional regulator [Dyadobacter frigoris]